MKSSENKRRYAREYYRKNKTRMNAHTRKYYQEHKKQASYYNYNYYVSMRPPLLTPEERSLRVTQWAHKKMREELNALLS
jgi:hypothetical protein